MPLSITLRGPQEPQLGQPGRSSRPRLGIHHHPAAPVDLQDPLGLAAPLALLALLLRPSRPRPLDPVDLQDPLGLAAPLVLLALLLRPSRPRPLDPVDLQDPLGLAALLDLAALPSTRRLRCHSRCGSSVQR